MTTQNATPVYAGIKTWPVAFQGQQMAVSGGTQYVRVGGQGPAVLLLHGFGDTGDMWVPLAEILVKEHTVIVPDLRGMGLSSHQDGGYEKTAQAHDFAGILGELGVRDVELFTDDIGKMVGYALAALHPARITRWVVMDSPLPGIGHWDKQLKNPKAWHFNFRGPDVERLVAGRERILLDRFYKRPWPNQDNSWRLSAVATLAVWRSIRALSRAALCSGTKATIMLVTELLQHWQPPRQKNTKLAPRCGVVGNVGYQSANLLTLVRELLRHQVGPWKVRRPTGPDKNMVRMLSTYS